MNLQMREYITQRFTLAAAAMGLALSAGCSDLHIAVNALLGKQPVIMTARNEVTQTFAPGGMRSMPGPVTKQERTVQAQPPADPVAPERASATQAGSPARPKTPEGAVHQAQPPAAPVAPQGVPKAGPPATPGAVQVQAPPSGHEAGPGLVLEGKRRAPGQVSPTAPPAGPVVEAPKTEFKADRDPFKPPSEVQVRTDYLPSTPLARFDYSQLKLVGVIQMAEGQIKGMVEDPDGRGYYVQPGMQIGDGPNMATVTQITNRGVMLRIHKTDRDVAIPLFSERSEPERL